MVFVSVCAYRSCNFELKRCDRCSWASETTIVTRRPAPTKSLLPSECQAFGRPKGMPAPALMAGSSLVRRRRWRFHDGVCLATAQSSPTESKWGGATEAPPFLSQAATVSPLTQTPLVRPPYSFGSALSAHTQFGLASRHRIVVGASHFQEPHVVRVTLPIWPRLSVADFRWGQSFPKNPTVCASRSQFGLVCRWRMGVGASPLPRTPRRVRRSTLCWSIK
jgi:hypothetical protein